MVIILEVLMPNINHHYDKFGVKNKQSEDLLVEETIFSIFQCVYFVILWGKNPDISYSQS